MAKANLLSPSGLAMPIGFYSRWIFFNIPLREFTKRAVVVC